VETLFILAVFVLGTIVGSFLNVVIFRLNTGRPVTAGRSYCFSCGQTLLAFDLIPIVSFICLGGRCRRCRSKISFQYPLVELVTGLVFTLIYIKLGASIDALLAAAIFAVLIAITVYDLCHKIIPDILSIIFAVLSVIVLLGGGEWDQSLVIHLVAGPLFYLPFYLLWKFSDGRLIGLGDGKLALGIGWFLGLSGGAATLILGFWLGAIVGLFLIFLSKIGLFLKAKPLTIKSELPFGPFLIIGAAIAFFADIDLITISHWFLW